MHLFNLFKYIAAQAIGECNKHKVDETVASKYRAISESNDGVVFTEFCFHTLLYQPPPQGYVFYSKLGRNADIFLNFGYLTDIQFFSVVCPAGLSVVLSDRVTGKQPLKGDMLTSRKVNTKMILVFK